MPAFKFKFVQKTTHKQGVFNVRASHADLQRNSSSNSSNTVTACIYSDLQAQLQQDKIMDLNWLRSLLLRRGTICVQKIENS